MIKKLLAGLSAFLLSISSLFVFAPLVASAAVDVCTWDGSSNSNWNTAANWSCATDGEAVPGAGDSLVFPYGAGVTNKNLTNDIAAGTSFASITFSGTASGGESSYTIGGNSIQLSSGIASTATSTSTPPQINIDITAAGDLILNATSDVQFGTSSVTDKTLSLSTHSLTISNGTYTSVSFYSKLTGSGDITSNHYLSFYNDNSDYTGTLTATGLNVALIYAKFGGHIVLNGTAYLTAAICDGGTQDLNLTVSSTVSDVLSHLVLSSGDCPSPEGGGAGGGGNCDDTNFIPCDVAIDESVFGGVMPTSGNITLAGTLELGTDTRIVGYTKNLSITSAMSGDHALTLLPGANAVLSLNGSSNTTKTVNGTYSPTRKVKKIDAGDESDAKVSANGYATLTVDGRRGDTYIQDGALINGTGKIAKLKIDKDSFVGPGHSPGCLSTGDLTEGGTYQVELGGTTACTGYDRLKVSGSVNVTDGILDVSFVNNFKGKAKDAFTIIDNDGSDAVVGTFKGLAEGATFKAAGYVLKISYKGGTGNDIVVSIVSVPGSPDTGFSLLFNNPAALLGSTLAAAGGILMISRRLQPKKARVRR